MIARKLGYFRALGVFGVLAVVSVLAVFTWWLTLVPSNDRDWLIDVAEQPSAVIDGDRLTVHNVRNFRYRSETDYAPAWETRSYDLADLHGIDLYLVYWGPTLIAHMLLSWEFEDDEGNRDHLAISIETRKEKGESYSALLGFFRQYELYYVVADERDVIGLRTNHRDEQVYLYPLTASRETARAVLLDYFAAINGLVKQPRWYNAMTHNCTTAARKHSIAVAGKSAWDWRFLLNGSIDELAYERGTVDTTLPFDEFRRRSNITERSKAAPLGPEYSDVIRNGLP